MAAGAKGKDKNKSWLMTGIEALTAGLMTVQRFYPVNPSTMGTTPEFLHNHKIVAGFLAATLPQANGGHGRDQRASDVVAWTTSRTIRNDVDSLAAAYIQYLQELLVMFVNETIPLLKEAVGVLQVIQVLSQYLSRSSDLSSQGGQQGASDPELSRTSSTLSMDSTSSRPRQLDMLVHWLVKLCRDQAVDDTTLTKALLSMMLQLEQECMTPQANADLLAVDDIEAGSASNIKLAMGPVSLGFGSVTASSVVAQCPEAATRLRLAADILLTYGMNHGGPNLPSLRDLPDEIPQEEGVEEGIMRLFNLKKEIGTEARFSVVTIRTSGVVADVLLQQVERSLEGLEWALGKLRFCGLAPAGKHLTPHYILLCPWLFCLFLTQSQPRPLSMCSRPLQSYPPQKTCSGQGKARGQEGLSKGCNQCRSRNRGFGRDIIAQRDPTLHRASASSGGQDGKWVNS